MVARIIPDWTPSDPNLPKSFIAKVSSLESSKQLMEDDEMAKAIKRTSINVQEILQQMEKNRAQVSKEHLYFSTFPHFITLYFTCFTLSST